MTNLKTAFGAIAWMGVSCLMLLGALEPIATGQPQQADGVARIALHSAA